MIRYRAIIRTRYKALQFSQTNASITKSFFSKIEADVMADGGIIGASESNVVITECMFQNNSGYVGVAVFSRKNSNVTIIESTFRYNQVSRYGHGFSSGGIFYFQEGTLTVICNCTIINNKLRGWSRERAFQGGVIITSSNLNVTASKFANNFPILNNFYYQGGAIRINGQSHITVYIHDCLFTHNSAQIGGAVYISGGRVDIRESIFIANTAVETGGAVAGYGTVNITGCTFQINIASSGGGLHLYNHYYGTTANINGSDFIGNIATVKGGALYVSNSYEGSTPLAITACKFSNNSATDGGAMLISSVVGNISIKDNVFINNRAEFEGGAMHLVDADLIDLENTLISNEAAGGGALYAKRSNIFILNSCYCNNTATYRAGGALEVLYSREYGVYWLVNISDSTFIHNTAYEDGGSIRVRGEALVSVVLTGNHFIGNRASDHGGALATDLSALASIIKNKFYNNFAHLGGAIYAESVSYLDLSFCVFVENHAEMGGALYINSTELSIYRTTTIIANNTADSSGGGVYLYQSKLSCYGESELKILRNHANDRGGGIYSWNTSIVVYYYSFVHSCTAISLIKNYGGNGGGLFLSMNSTVYIFNHLGSNVSVQ